MLDLGTVLPGSTIRIPFSTFDKDDGSSITMTNFAAADILIYKDGSTTERASTSGYTATTDFDTKTGKHLIIIDLADNTTADFYAAGSEYLVALDSVTVDTVTVGGWLARFKIGVVGAILDTTIATLASQTSFTLTAGSADDNSLVGCTAVIHDAASAVQKALGVVSAYTGTTKTVTLAADPAVFTMAAKDNISFLPPVNVKWWATGVVPTPTVAGVPNVNTKTINDVATTAVTTIKAVQGLAVDGVITTLTNLPAITTDWISAAGVSAAAVTKIQTGLATPTNITAGTITTTTNLTNLPTIPTNWLTADGLATDAISEIQSGLATASNLATVAGYLDTEIAAILADTNELQTDWVNGGRLDLILDARASQTSVDTIDDFLDTEIAAIKAKTDQFVFTVAGQVDANALSGGGGLDAAGVRTAIGLASANLDTQLSTIDDFLDTEVAAIKTVTDAIGATGSGLSAIPWNASWDAEVQSEVSDALSVLYLDKLVAATGTVSNALSDATTTVFKTSLTAVNNTYNDQLLVFTSGALAQQCKPVSAYVQTNGVITLGEALTAAPSDGVSFIIMANHVHPVSQIQAGLSTLDAAGVRTAIGLTSANLDTQLSTIDDFLDTEVAAIKAKTDNLPADPTDASDIASSFSTVNSTLSTISGYLDTEIAAIKAKTDNLPTDPADASDISSAFSTVNSTLSTIAGYIDTEIGTIQTAVGTTIPATLSTISGYIDTEVAAIKAKTDLIPSDPADASDIAALIDALPTAAENAAALLDYTDGVETSVTLKQALRLILAAAAGKLSGAATTTITIRNVGDTKDRIIATVDSSGNRSAITTDLT